MESILLTLAQKYIWFHEDNLLYLQALKGENQAWKALPQKKKREQQKNIVLLTQLNAKQ